MQWQAFTGKSKLRLKEANLGKVVAVVRNFLMPVISDRALYAGKWSKGGLWR
jgi:hypothetical protein